MKHTRLGRTGLQVSRLCLGTMTFGLQCDEPTSRRDHGPRRRRAAITFFDTADVYPLGGDRTNGRPHRGDRRPLAQGPARAIHPRHEVLRTLGPGALGPGQLAQAHPRRGRRIAAPAADRLHRPLPAARPRPGNADRRDAAARSTTSCARARCATSAARTSSPTSWRGRSAAARRWASCASTPCSRATTCCSARSNASCLPLCAEEGIGVIPYNPIAGGLLTGKHDRAERATREGSRFTLGTAAQRTRTGTGTKACSRPSSRLRPLAAEAGMPLPQMAVAWVLANPAITAPIVGASRPEQLDDTLAAAETPLPDAQAATWTN